MTAWHLILSYNFESYYAISQHIISYSYIHHIILLYTYISCSTTVYRLWYIVHSYSLLPWTQSIYRFEGRCTVEWVCSWWRHQKESFSALLVICAGNSPVPGEFPTQRPATRSFNVFFDLRLNKPFSKQPWGWWFETLSRSVWRHRNELS